MNESYDQFIARTHQQPKPLPIWGSALVFLLMFFALQAGYGACRGTWFEHLVIGKLTTVPAAALIATLTPDVGVKPLGNQLIAPGGGIVVKQGCEGTEVMFMLAAAFAAVSMPWRRKLAGLGVGLGLVFCLNLLRLAALFYAFRSDPGLFSLLHGTVAPIAIVIAVALYVFFWIDHVSDTRDRNTSAAE